MLIIRCISASYWLLLTTLLLLPDPLGMLGLRKAPLVGSGACIHFIFFALLAALVLASRSGLPRVALASLLIGYATVTELLQSSVGRHTSATDLLANLLGLAAGTWIWSVLEKRATRTPDKRT